MIVVTHEMAFAREVGRPGRLHGRRRGRGVRATRGRSQQPAARAHQDVPDPAALRARTPVKPRERAGPVDGTGPLAVHIKPAEWKDVRRGGPIGRPTRGRQCERRRTFRRGPPEHPGGQRLPRGTAVGDRQAWRPASTSPSTTSRTCGSPSTRPARMVLPQARTARPDLHVRPRAAAADRAHGAVVPPRPASRNRLVRLDRAGRPDQLGGRRASTAGSPSRWPATATATE